MKVDLKKELDSYRAQHQEFRILDVPPRQYLMVDGHGDPNTAAEYADALAAVYPVAYRLKFASKALGRDHVVMPLEALWWSADLAAFTSQRDKSRWDWTTMIMVPDWITREMFDLAVAQVADRSGPTSVQKVRLESLAEGRCVQTLHVGSYDDEADLLERLHHRFLPQAGLAPTGKHHEIYLNDPRRVEPAKLRTILRQPATTAGPDPLV